MGEVDLKTEVGFGFEKKVKAKYCFSYEDSKWLGFA